MLICKFPNVSCLGRVLSALVGLATGVMFALWNLEGELGSVTHKYTAHNHYHAPVVWANNHLIADDLRKKVRVLCWIMTGPDNHQTKAQHVRLTWGRHCDTLLFMTSLEDPVLPGSIPLEVAEGRDHLWMKTKKAFQYVYENHKDDADWFLKADDDSFVIMENLRAFLHPYPAEMPIYFGRKFILGNMVPVQGYMSGGAGYVLSKEALKRFIEVGLDDPRMCNLGNGASEDVEMGKCMENLRIVAGDSRDSDDRDRFFPLSLHYHLGKNNDRYTFWYYNYSYYPPITGRTSVPPSAISFHYIGPNWMYILDYMIYNVRTFGRGQISLPIDEKKKTLDEVHKHLAAVQPYRDYSSQPWLMDQLKDLKLEPNN